MYIYTTESDGVERIAVGSDGIPFIYTTDEALKKNNNSEMIEMMQEWANRAGIKIRLQRFIPDKLVDIIEPMNSKLTM
jgi:hypothetical protein